jgi:HEAT repeat protein
MRRIIPIFLPSLAVYLLAACSVVFAADPLYRADGTDGLEGAQPSGRTMADWVAMATKARSESNRLEGTERLRQLAFLQTSGNGLPDADLATLVTGLAVCCADPSAAVKFRAISALQDLRSEKASTPILLKVAAGDKLADVRAEAIRALGRTKATGAVDALATIAVDPQQPFAVQDAAVESLGKIGGAAAKRHLGNLLAATKSPEAKAAIERALDAAESLGP